MSRPRTWRASISTRRSDSGSSITSTAARRHTSADGSCLEVDLEGAVLERDVPLLGDPGPPGVREVLAQRREGGATGDGPAAGQARLDPRVGAVAVAPYRDVDPRHRIPCVSAEIPFRSFQRCQRSPRYGRERAGL